MRRSVLPRPPVAPPEETGGGGTAMARPEVEDAVDPGNVSHLNHDVAPSAAGAVLSST